MKEGIETLLNYKKPASWALFTVFIACIACAVILLANPARAHGAKYETGYVSAAGGGTDCEGVYLTLRDLKLDASPTILTVTWHNDTEDEVNFGEYYWIYRYEDGEWVSCATRAMSLIPTSRSYCPPDVGRLKVIIITASTSPGPVPTGWRRISFSIRMCRSRRMSTIMCGLILR